MVIQGDQVGAVVKIIHLLAQVARELDQKDLQAEPQPLALQRDQVVAGALLK